MRDGQPLLYGPSGEVLFVFRSHKPYQRSLAGFRPPEDYDDDEARGAVLDDEGPAGAEESDEGEEAYGMEILGSSETEDESCFSSY